MGQQNGAAQPLMGFVQKFVSLGDKLGLTKRSKEKPNEEAVSQSKKMNDDAVKRANDSFKTSADKPAPKTKTGKPAPRKRAAAKRY